MSPAPFPACNQEVFASDLPSSPALACVSFSKACPHPSCSQIYLRHCVHQKRGLRALLRAGRCQLWGLVGAQQHKQPLRTSKRSSPRKLIFSFALCADGMTVSKLLSHMAPRRSFLSLISDEHWPHNPTQAAAAEGDVPALEPLENLLQSPSRCTGVPGWQEFCSHSNSKGANLSQQSRSGFGALRQSKD